MKKKRKLRNIALATAGVTLVSAIPLQAIAQESEVKTQSYDVSSADLRLAVGETTTLSAVADFLKDKTETDDYKIEWSVNEDSKEVVKVDSRGKVSALAAGTAEVTALIKGKTNLKATVVIDVYSTVEDLKINNKVINLRVGESLPIEYQLLPATAVEQDVKFVSDDAKIAKVDGKGVVTGTAEGTTTILVTPLDAGDKPFTKPIAEEITVNVTSTVTGVQFTNVPNKQLTLEAGETYQLLCDVLPSNAFLKDVTFKVSNSKAATVSPKGVIKASANGGSTKVEVVTKDGEHVDTIFVTVTGGKYIAPLTAISIEAERQKNGEKFIDLFVGEETPLKVSPTPKDFYLPTNALGYEVEDPSILEVKSNGGMIAHKPGTTKVKVYYDANESIYDEVTVTIKSTVTGIKGEDTWTIRVGEIASPPVYVLPIDTSENKDLILAHDGKGILKIANKHELEGLKAGTVNATFITEDGGYEHTMTINVVSTVTSFDIPFETVKLGLEPYQFEPVFNKDAYLKEVKYEVENRDVVTINTKTNTITPKKEGTTKVIAKTVDGELVDEFEVVVDYEAKKIDIYDENDNLIGTSDPIPTKPGNGNGSNNKEIRKMILEKLLEKTNSSIAREVIKRLLTKI